MKRTERQGEASYQGAKSDEGLTPPAEFRPVRSRIMYIENKSAGLNGPARIGRVYFSKTGKTLYYRGMTFQSLKGSGYKSNYYEISTGNEYWISGVRKDQNNRLYGGNHGVEIDEDAREEYCSLIGRVG